MTPVLNNGLFYRQTIFDARSHVAANYLPTMPVDKITDLGPVEYWAQTRKSELPLYKMSSFGGRNVVEIDGSVARYQVPVSADDTVEIVEDLTTTDKPGLDGTPFEIMLSTDRFGYGDLLKFSQFSNAEMVVDPAYPIKEKGEAFIYTVKLLDNSNVKFLDKKYLVPGSRVGKFGSVIPTEFGQNYSSWSLKGIGEREYLLKIGDASAQTSYWVSNRANEHGISLQNYKRIMEYVQINDSGDPTITDLNKYMTSVGMSPLDLGKKAAAGQATMKFAFAMDDISMRLLARDYENQLMWGTGGRLILDGADEIQLPIGLWQQLNSGYVHAYNFSNFSKYLFINAYHNYFLGKRDYVDPGNEPTVNIDTGWGGMTLVNDMISKESNSNAFTQDANKNGIIKGEGLNREFVGSWFTTWTIPGLVRIQFKYNPAFDNIHMKNDIDNPKMQTGYNLSSYSFIMYDIDDMSSNVQLLRNKNAKIKMMVQNGRDTHPLFEMGNGTISKFQSNTRKSGFGVAFERPYDAIRVIDPTRILKIVMYNSKTGLPFGGLV